MDSDGGSKARGSMTVVGIAYYPDETNFTIVVPEGAEVIGAGGTNCTYIIEKGGTVTAHSGTNNTYKVKAGGKFRGFLHDATKCTVKYAEGAIIEKEQAGEGTTFVSGL